MKTLFSTILIFFLFIVTSAHSGYSLINRDFILASNQAKITFSPASYKKEFQISYQPCPTCDWQSAKSNLESEYYFQTLPVSFSKFKKKVKEFHHNPPKKDYKVFLSIDSRNNNVFTVKLDYVEL